jgi:hypothetical protein
MGHVNNNAAWKEIIFCDNSNYTGDDSKFPELKIKGWIFRIAPQTIPLGKKRIAQPIELQINST